MVMAGVAHRRSQLSYPIRGGRHRSPGFDDESGLAIQHPWIKGAASPYTATKASLIAAHLNSVLHSVINHRLNPPGCGTRMTSES